jgi:hypothetical protein
LYALLCTVAALWLTACGSTRTTTLEGQSSADGICDSSAVFGFENRFLWLPAAGGTVSSSSRRVQGSSSLRLQGTAHSKVTSTLTCLPPATWSKLSLYVATTSTTAPATSVTASVNLSSVLSGLTNTQVGSRAVTLTANGVFTRVEFDVPASVASKLELGAVDLFVSVAFDGSAPVDFLLDELSLTRGVVPSVPGTGPLRTANIHLAYPQNADLLTTAMLGQQGVTISANAKLVHDCDGLNAVASVGTQATSIGLAALTGSIVSVPNVTLGNLSVITGDVTSAGTISRGAGVTVTGQLTSGATLTPLQSLDWQIQYNEGTTSVVLGPLAQRTLSPGAYTTVSVPAGAQLTLSTGTYYFNSLSVGLGGDLAVVTDSGPVVVYVKDSVTYTGSVDYYGPPGQLVIVYTGTSPIFLQTSFDGFIVAPESAVRFGVGLKPHAGAAFAKTVLLDPFALFAPRNAFPIITAIMTPGAAGGDSNKSDCTHIISTSTFAKTATPRDIQAAVLRFCAGSSMGPCELALTAESQTDLTAAARQVLAGTMAPCKYLTLSLNRERILKTIHGDEGLACSIFNADPDGDLVPTSADSCANTPALSAVLDNGCTDSSCPNTPPLTEIVAGMPKYVALSTDPRCKNAPSPKVASPFGAWRYPPDPTVGKALWISRDPDTSGCPQYYVLQGKLTDGSIQTVIFQPNEDVNLPWIQRPDNVLQFNIHAGDPQGRGAWARYSVYTDRYRVRVFNAAGRRSDWSNWFLPGQEGCAAGGPCGD